MPASMEDTNCPICHTTCRITWKDQRRYRFVECSRCGTFEYHEHSNIEDKLNQVLLSHWTRKNQRTDDIISFDRYKIEQVLDYFTLPKPKEQADNLINLLGSNISTPEEKFVIDNPERWAAIIGAKNEEGLAYVLKRLKEKSLIEGNIPHSLDGYSLNNQPIGLTFDGWDYYDQLVKGQITSDYAFMAMEFDNKNLDKVFFNYFKPAVAETGFDLRRLDEKPKAGLIDNRLRTEIRNAIFLLVDLTNDNSGAYWEGGYGEALGKPVIYTCERSYFKKSKTHFDTNHHYTIIYEIGNIQKYVDELKATIRTTLPLKAKMEDK